MTSINAKYKFDRQDERNVCQYIKHNGWRGSLIRCQTPWTPHVHGAKARLDWMRQVNPLKEIESTMKGAEGAINKATQAQAQFTKEVKETEKAGDKLASVLKGLVGVAVLVGVTKKLIETSDQMTLITGRLDNINDGAQTTAELIDMIQKSAGRGRAEFFATADAVAKLVNNTGDLFTTTREAVEFTELLNKTFSASGSSAQEISSVMLQLNQAMAMNTLRAQEFNAIISGAPKIIEYIAKSMGVAKK